MKEDTALTYKKLKSFYGEYFSIGYLNPTKDEKFTPFEKRLILISLICYVTHKNKQKNPDITHYSIIMKLSQNLGLPDKFIVGLSIVCDDFAYQCNEFPTFGFEGKEILKVVREILSSYMPF